MAEPMYKRVAEDLRGRIESGEIAQGSKLPTEVELMDEYGEKFGSPYWRGLDLAKYRPGRDQAAGHPRPGSEPRREGHLRRPED